MKCDCGGGFAEQLTSSLLFHLLPSPASLILPSSGPPFKISLLCLSLPRSTLFNVHTAFSLLLVCQSRGPTNSICLPTLKKSRFALTFFFLWQSISLLMKYSQRFLGTSAAHHTTCQRLTLPTSSDIFGWMSQDVPFVLGPKSHAGDVVSDFRKASSNYSWNQSPKISELFVHTSLGTRHQILIIKHQSRISGLIMSSSKQKISQTI